jgi:histone H3
LETHFNFKTIPGPSGASHKSFSPMPRVKSVSAKNAQEEVVERTKPSKALAEIRKLQRSADLLIPKAPFVRLVKEISRDFGDASVEYRFEASAIEALQEISEAYLVGLFEDSALAMTHGLRKTLKPKDMRLVQVLRGEVDGRVARGKAEPSNQPAELRPVKNLVKKPKQLAPPVNPFPVQPAAPAPAFAPVAPVAPVAAANDEDTASWSDNEDELARYADSLGPLVADATQILSQ